MNSDSYNQESAPQQLQAFSEGGFAVDAYMQLYFNGSATWQIRDAWERANPYNPGMLWIAMEHKYGSVALRISALWEALLTCRELGVKPGIYTAHWFWVGYMNNTQAFKDFLLWAAQYDGVADLSAFTPFGGWTAPTVKQFQGSVDFGGVYCDVNCRML